MQTFIDTTIPSGQPGHSWQFEEDVIVSQEEGAYIFTAAHGVRLDVPTTLVPGELPPVEPAEPLPITVFSSLDYLSKFTDAEYTATRTHASMQIQRGLDSLIAAQYVDLADPRVTGYLDALVSGGVIDESRKAELLTPQAA